MCNENLRLIAWNKVSLSADLHASFLADMRLIDACEATVGNMSQPSAVSNSVKVKYVMYTIIDIVIMDYIDSYIIYDLRCFAVEWLHVYV